jgi:hypothetical protein
VRVPLALLCLSPVLWYARGAQCVNTFEGHSERVWTLAVGKTRHVVPALAPGEPDTSVVCDLEIISGM